VQQFRAFGQQFTGKLLKQDALFKAGLAQLLAGNRQGFLDDMRRTVAAPPSGFDEDDYAARQAAHYLANFPNENDLRLLRARLRFDGGYIGQCEAELQSVAAELAALTVDQRTELYYRQGRLWHYRGDPVKAKAYYTLCAKQHTQRNVWMQAFAHFYMGKIFEESAQWHEARYHFREALTYTGYPYQNGLEQRCRSGLSRLRNRTFEVPGN
jgi:ATP/maltotriose-dependent transcriptional regulator MalT